MSACLASQHRYGGYDDGDDEAYQTYLSRDPGAGAKQSQPQGSHSHGMDYGLDDMDHSASFGTKDSFGVEHMGYKASAHDHGAARDHKEDKHGVTVSSFDNDDGYGRWS